MTALREWTLRRRRALLVAAGLIALLLTLSQLLVPRLAEREIESRLTEGGGSAEVALTARPALRLLLGDASSLEVRGEDLNLESPDLDQDALERLAGIDEVDVALDEFSAGPLELKRFELRRSGEGPYEILAIGTTTGSDLLAFGAEQIGGFAGALAGGALEGAAGFGLDANRRVPFEIDVGVEQSDGELEVVSGQGTIANIPAGALIEFLTATVVQQLL